MSYLKTIGTPESLLKSWIGHSSGNDVTARYDRSTDDKEWRQSWANKCGIGFDLPILVPSAAQKPKPAPNAKTAKKVKPPKHSSEAALVASAEPHKQPYSAVDNDLDEFFYTTRELGTEEV